MSAAAYFYDVCDGKITRCEPQAIVQPDGRVKLKQIRIVNGPTGKPCPPALPQHAPPGVLRPSLHQSRTPDASPRNLMLDTYLYCQPMNVNLGCLKTSTPLDDERTRYVTSLGSYLCRRLRRSDRPRQSRRAETPQPDRPADQRVLSRLAPHPSSLSHPLAPVAMCGRGGR